jgi:hypothetical protein
MLFPDVLRMAENRLSGRTFNCPGAVSEETVFSFYIPCFQKRLEVRFFVEDGEKPYFFS